MWYYLHASNPKWQNETEARAPISTFLYNLSLEDGTYRLSRNVGKYQLTLLNIPEERIPHLHYDESVKRFFLSHLFRSSVEASLSAYVIWLGKNEENICVEELWKNRKTVEKFIELIIEDKS
jgi:hypothetical protein